MHELITSNSISIDISTVLIKVKTKVFAVGEVRKMHYKIFKVSVQILPGNFDYSTELITLKIF